MAQKEYREYLNSPGWDKKREAALKRAGGRCQLCNYPNDLEVHHRTYDRVKRERVGDLFVLCEKCHKRFHGKLPTLKEHNLTKMLLGIVVEAGKAFDVPTENAVEIVFEMLKREFGRGKGNV